MNISKIKELVENYPNDMELGKKVRAMYWSTHSTLEKQKDVYIYESPDGGKTIYRRPFGGDPTSTRELVEQTTDKV